MAGALHLSAGEQARRDRAKGRWRLAYALCAVLGLAGCALLLSQGYPPEGLKDSVLLVEVLCLAFGAYLCFFAKETLPAYYDQNRITTYSSGVFRMNLAGLPLNNSNWPHILNAMRGWLLGTAAVFPPAWWGLHALWPGRAPELEMPLTLIACLGFFLPAYVAGKKWG